MSKEARIFFHEKLEDDKHIEKQVKAIIVLFPESISQLDKDGLLPIQTASMSRDHSGSRSSITSVSMMAREGCCLGVTLRHAHDD